MPHQSSAIKPKIGRPTKYDQTWHPDMAYKFALLGLTGKEIARLFEIAESTFELWKVKYSEFSESIKRGGNYADAQVVEKLYQNAMGFVYKSQQAVTVKKGKDIEEIQIVVLYKENPPDPKAIAYWLKNRQRHSWKDSHYPDHGHKKTKDVIEIFKESRQRLNSNNQI